VVENIVLQFNKDVFNVGEINTLPTPLVDKVNNSLVQAQLWGKNVGICIVGSNLARDFDAIGDSAFIDYALATMESMFGSSVSGARVCVSSGPDIRVRSATSFPMQAASRSCRPPRWSPSDAAPDRVP